MMVKLRRNHAVQLLLCALLLSLASCSSNIATTTVRKTFVTSKITPLMAFETSCPARGTARPAIMDPVPLGTHPVIVYTQLSSDTTTFAIRRYDIITKHITDIVHAPFNPNMDRAQVSAGGQWILFSSFRENALAIQLVRIDGKELQTLYCIQPDASGVYFDEGLDWSPNQQSLLFMTQSGAVALHLLTLKTGHVQDVLTFPDQKSVLYWPAAWLDSQHVYLYNRTGYVRELSSVALLDVAHSGHITQLTPSNNPYTDFIPSVDKAHLFLAQGNPLTLSVEGATGGKPSIIYTSNTPGSVSLQTVSPTQLLFMLSDSMMRGAPNPALAGLWKIQTDGTHPVHLATGVLQQATVSRDRQYYAIMRINVHDGTASLLFGRITGGVPTSLVTAFYSDKSLMLAGWTTM